MHRAGMIGISVSAGADGRKNDDVDALLCLEWGIRNCSDDRKIPWFEAETWNLGVPNCESYFTAKNPKSSHIRLWVQDCFTYDRRAGYCSHRIDSVQYERSNSVTQRLKNMQ